jgi:hypothetical protein
MDHDDTVTLVHENSEALMIAASYAIRKSRELEENLWQWEAINTTGRAKRTKMGNVGGLRNQLCVFVGMPVMLLKNSCGRVHRTPNRT